MNTQFFYTSVSGGQTSTKHFLPHVYPATVCRLTHWWRIFWVSSLNPARYFTNCLLWLANKLAVQSHSVSQITLSVLKADMIYLPASPNGVSPQRTKTSEFLTALNLKMAVFFWVVASCILAGALRRFTGPRFFHDYSPRWWWRQKNLQIVGILLPDFKTQQPRKKAVTFVLAVLKTLNLTLPCNLYSRHSVDQKAITH